LIRLLRALGHDASYYIPDRLLEGYGPSGAALLRLGEAGAQLIVTVDCGAQAFDALAQAHGAGLEVIVVDHHQCAPELPTALALVNPNRLDENAQGAAHGHLAAVGVAFLLGAALVRDLRGRGYFATCPEPDLLTLLDLVALGTVADVAQLKGLNRAFVAQGVKVMAARRNTGLSALIDVAGLKRAVQCSDLGFALGPRINAGGRVGKSDLGVRLLTTEDTGEARALAAQLDQLNQERRAIEAEVLQAAEVMARGQGARATILVAAREWHPGVIGIVAGRLKDKFNRPVFVIAIDENGVGKGSGRSVTGVDLGALVLAAKARGMLVAGGGHEMAAGVTLAQDQIAALHDFLDVRVAALAGQTVQTALNIDLLLAPAGLNPALVQMLETGGPYGTGWPAPRIATGPLRIIKADLVGTDHVRTIMAGRDGASFKAMAFRQAVTPLGQALLGAPKDRALYAAGRIKIDDWGGRGATELHLDDALWAA
ncbi:MAG: single-stranded-DNA-specific exonuclease RecJ, partial [Alphaproteobacteria bacterium]|nr:single-stranded-DNA-specific exonuclease RecJ [Alphaproteobacteria bacterium]